MASLSFGYIPSEVQDTSTHDPSFQSTTEGSKISRGPLGPTLSRLYSYRPQSMAFSLCDSPIGLLAGLLDVIHTQAPPSLEYITSRSRSPFLSPIELEQQESGHGRSSIETAIRSTPAEPNEYFTNPQESEASLRSYSWSVTEVRWFYRI